MKQYAPPEALRAQVTRAFVSVATFQATPDQHDRKDHLGRAFDTLANEIIRYTPTSREQSLALTHLEEAFGWVARAIRTERPGGDQPL